METVALLYEDYQKELAEDFKNTFLKRASDTDSSRSNDTVIDEVTDMLSTNIAVYTEKLLQRWGFSSGGEGGGGGDVTVTLDDLLKKYLSDNYVTIKGDQEVYGEKDFRKGIRIAGRRLYWDESNDALVIEGAAYTTRWLSAYGMSPGGGGAGSGGAAAMYQLIDVSPNDTKDAVLGAEKDYVLTFDGNFWRGMPNKGGLSSKLFTALDKDGNEVNPDDENSEIYAIRANYSLWSVGFLSAKGISDGGAGGGGGGAVALYQLLDVEKNSDITGVAGATKGSVLTFNGDKWYADKPKTAEGINRLFSALDADGNEVDLNDESKLGTITNIRANYALWSVDWISAKGKSSGGSGGTGGASALYQLVDVLANDTGDGVDGAVAGKALVFDGTHWKAADAGLNESQLSAFLSLNGYLTQTAADGRYVTSARKVIAGTGLSGGGSLTSDVTLSLGTSGVVAGTYTKVMVDVYGRVTSGTSLSATDIPSLDWSKITTGKPTTLAGYGITDAYSKTEADGKYVTIATAQTISGAKTFSAVTKTASVLPSADANSELGGTANRWNNIYSVNGTFSQNVTAKLLSASETLQIGDAYLKWDSTNNAVYVIKKDGTTPVGFYSTDWLSAKGVSMSGVQTGTLADLTDVEITNPTNGQALKYDAISQKWVNGTIDSFNVNQMWTELTKADSSKVIDASHIPTSVLDNRWVKKAGDTMTGTLTSASTTGSIIFKGLENCDITNIYTNNGTLYSDTNLAIRNGLRFNWYDTYWYIGNLRGAGTNSSGFGIANESNKLCLQVTPDYTTAPVFRSSASQGTAPLIVYSTTQVSNLNADLLDDKHGAYYQNRVYDTFVSQYTQYDYIEFLRFVIPSGQNQLRAYVVFDLCRTETGNESSGRAVLRLRRNTDNTASTLFYVTNFGRSTLPELRCTSDDGITWRIWMKCNKSGYDPYIAVKIVEQYPYGYVTTQNNGTTGTPEGTRHVFTALSAGISNAANFLVNSRTLWGQPFNGTANVSGDMTGVGSITMSGDLKIGNATSPNTIYFYGTTGDGPGGYNHTFIAERLWGGTESGELVLFKGNDIGNGTDAITASNSGPDRIRHIAAAHLFQTYTTVLSGSVESVCTSSALKNLFSIASNRVISYVQLQSTIASGVAPFIVASNTVVSNLNADLLDGQHLSDLDGRYVNVTGDTMTGDLTMNNTKGFNIGWSTRVAKNSGVWIHGGADAASSTDANLRFASWNGIGWYPTISGQTVAQGENAMWLNVRTGVLNVAGGIKESNICIGRVDSNGNYNINCAGEISRYDHHLYLQRNSGKNLIMCTGGGLAGIGTDSPRAKLDVAGNVYSTGFFYSTVGTGTAPYQCSSTTLNTNLNADLLDGYHQTAFSMGWTSSTKYRLDRWGGGQDKNWKKIVTYVNTDGGQYQSCKVKGTIYFITGNHNQGHVVDMPFEAIMYAYGGTMNSMLNQSTLYLPPYCSWDLIRIVRYANNSWEVQVRQPNDWTNISLEYTVTNNGGSVSAGQFANTSYSSTVANNYNTNVSRPTSSRVLYADRLTTARTLWGRSFDGTANIDGSLDNVGVITSKGGIWLDLKGSSGVAFYSGGSLSAVINSTGMGIGNSSPSQKLHVTGNIIATGAITAKASSSDIRLKTDIQDYDAMGIIRKFRSVKYHWNNLAKRNSEIFNHKKWNYGLIAQDLLSGGYSQWVSDIFKDYYTIDYERLIPVVWKGLQEVDDEVTKLRKEVVRLNKRISELEKFLCA